MGPARSYPEGKMQVTASYGCNFCMATHMHCATQLAILRTAAARTDKPGGWSHQGVGWVSSTISATSASTSGPRSLASRGGCCEYSYNWGQVEH